MAAVPQEGVRGGCERDLEVEPKEEIYTFPIERKHNSNVIAPRCKFRVQEMGLSLQGEPLEGACYLLLTGLTSHADQTKLGNAGWEVTLLLTTASSQATV